MMYHVCVCVIHPVVHHDVLLPVHTFHLVVAVICCVIPHVLLGAPGNIVVVFDNPSQ